MDNERFVNLRICLIVSRIKWLKVLRSTAPKSTLYAFHGFVLSAYRVLRRSCGRIRSPCALQSARRAERLGPRNVPGTPRRAHARNSESQATESGLVGGISASILTGLVRMSNRIA